MGAVVFYSNTGQSKAIAEYFSEQLGYHLIDIESCAENNFDSLVLVFPVLCQNIPEIVIEFLKKIGVTYLTVIATYGKMCPGNVLYEIQQIYKHNIVAGAYIPTKHAYIENDEAFYDFDRLTPIVEKVKNPATVKLPRLFKNPLADISPSGRSRLGLKLYKTEACDGCNLCGRSCSFNAINSGATTPDCNRCLRCVCICPHNALKYKLRIPLKLYLRKKKKDKIIIYV